MKGLSLFLALFIAIGSLNLGVGLESVYASEKNSARDLTVEERGQILENFKKKQKEVIFTQGADIDSEDLDILEKMEKTDALEALKKRAEEKRKEIEAKHEFLNQKSLTLKEMIWELDESISVKKENISKINAEIITYVKEINKNRKDIEEMKFKIKNNRKVLSEYLVHIYKEQNNIYNEGDVDSIKTIVLWGGNLWDVLMDYNFNIIVQVAWEKLIQKHRDYVKELYVLKSDLSKRINDSKKVKRKLQLTKRVLEEKISLKEDILEKTNWQEYIYKKYLKERVREEKEAKSTYIREKLEYDRLKDEIAEKYGCDNLSWDVESDSEKCTNIEKMIKAENTLASLGSDFNPVWPINPELWISAYFSDNEYYKTFDSTHDAIDLIAEQWTPVVAVEDAYVAFVNKPELGNYSYVALKHANNMITVYGHLSSVEVEKYDIVRAWEVFAYTGWEIWTEWAWIMTTWPHLHFELFDGETPRDPLNYLDLTALPLDELPLDRYFYKYYDDYKARYGLVWSEDIQERMAFKLDGDTEIERQKNAVWKYWVNGFWNWNLWIEEGYEAKIDPSFMICVWIAESGLGRRLKTKNNVWNVWNTDSGSTYQFESPRVWIYRMWKTFNNPYLGGYNELRMLSRYWNKDKAIYASDPINWHNNIVKCLSEMKGYYVSDDYNFRLTADELDMYTDYVDPESLAKMTASRKRFEAKEKARKAALRN